MAETLGARFMASPVRRMRPAAVGQKRLSIVLGHYRLLVVKRKDETGLETTLLQRVHGD